MKLIFAKMRTKINTLTNSSIQQKNKSINNIIHVIKYILLSAFLLGQVWITETEQMIVEFKK